MEDDQQVISLAIDQHCHFLGLSERLKTLLFIYYFYFYETYISTE